MSLLTSYVLSWNLAIHRNCTGTCFIVSATTDSVIICNNTRQSLNTVATVPFRFVGTVAGYEAMVPSIIYVFIYANLCIHFCFRHRCMYNVHAISRWNFDVVGHLGSELGLKPAELPIPRMRLDSTVASSATVPSRCTVRYHPSWR